MNLFSFPLIKSRLPQQIASNSWEEREVIFNSNVNLFCWKRPVDIVISSYLGQLLEHPLEPIQFHADVENLNVRLSQERSKWDNRPMRAADLFWEDVARLSTDFLKLSEDGTGTILMKVIESNSCAKFHTDGYSLRLFTTYYGPGTEWLPEKATNRKGLGKSNELIVKDPQQIQRMSPFEVGILKGELPNRPIAVKGIVHRSPAILQTGEKRIILRVDT